MESHFIFLVFNCFIHNLLPFTVAYDDERPHEIFQIQWFGLHAALNIILHAMRSFRH